MAGGHTLDPAKAHVGATDEQMLHRLATDSRADRVSSFYDQDHAERAVAENLAANKHDIDSWLQGGKFRRRLVFVHDHAVGRTALMKDGAPWFQDVTRSRVVLERDATMPLGFKVLTSFPDP